MNLELYIKEVSSPFLKLYIKRKEWLETAIANHHPGKQSEPGGLKIHIEQVINKALELNQTCDRKEIIECCLVHDLPGCEKLPLTEAQRLAIGATKGLKFEVWRHTPYYRFVCLILISDMWSAFINEKNLWN